MWVSLLPLRWGKGDTGHLCWYIAAATAGGGRLDMTQVSSIPMCATGLEG